MIIDKTNKIDESLGSKRYISDEQPGISLIIHDDGRATITTRFPIDFNSLDEVKSIENAINEFKDFMSL